MPSREDREQALAVALRENLRRRKAQARAAHGQPDAAETESDAAKDSADADPLSAEPRRTR